MSGITGFYYRDGQVAERAVLEHMLERIKHRGPDGYGVWCRDSVGLAQCTRWSTPESLQERQPLLSREADLVLVADARIDNREEIIERLRLAYIPSETISDTQLILKAYQEWGEACPEHLEGDFAFVIWDARRQLMFCARDAAGAKPFYYHLSSKLFAFASEIKALLVLQEIPRVLNEQKVANFLLWSFEDTENTFYEDINRLPPGCSIVIKNDRQQQNIFWELDASRELHFSDDQEYVLAFQEKFSAAVRSRMRSYYPLGSTLSGGLDSTSIACVARNHVQKNTAPLNTYSMIFADREGVDWSLLDERRYIDQVLKLGGFKPHYVESNSLNPLLDPAEMYAVLDEPYLAPTIYLFWNLYQHVKNSGTSVLLDGTDGDRTVSHGIEYLADLARNGRWLALWREVKAYKAFGNEASSAAYLAWKHGFRSLVPPLIIEYKQKWIGKNSPPDLKRQLLKNEFKHRISLDNKQPANNHDPQGLLVNSRHKHWQTLVSGVNALSLELFDKVSANHNIEVRYPFYDRRLMEFCLALPPAQKFNQGRTRYILRAAMEGIIPLDVQKRSTKANLPAAFSGRLYQLGEKKLLFLVEQSAKVLDQYIEPKIIRNIYIRYSTDPLRWIGDAFSLYGVFVLANWLAFAGFS